MKTVTFDESVWQLVPVEPTSAMLIASGSTAPRYQAMLAAAPKLEGGAA